MMKSLEVVHNQNKVKENGKEIVDYEHKLCILVPFRDRFEELLGKLSSHVKYTVCFFMRSFLKAILPHL